MLVQDFSTPVFDGQHHVIVGGSFASTGNEASVFSRQNFRPHFHQHAGFRLVAPMKEEEATRFVTSCTGQYIYISSTVVLCLPFMHRVPFLQSANKKARWDTLPRLDTSKYVSAGFFYLYTSPFRFGRLFSRF